MTHFEAFFAAYSRLASVYGQQVDGDAMQAHYEAVGTIPLELFAPVATRLARGSKWWPKPAEWLEACEAEQDARRRAIDHKLEQWVETFHCPTCRDSGWVYHECRPGVFCSACQRHPTRHMYDHTYVTRCDCWRTNPELERRRQAQRETVQAPKRAA